MSIKSQMDFMLPEIESELKRAVFHGARDEWREMYAMLAYHMGWEGEGAGSEAQGKRIRPLLVTLTTAACEGDWHAALPAAAAVELVHNFSLIHDDIEDTSALRHGRPTVWKLWGVAQAINAGDALLTLAHLSLLSLSNKVEPAVILNASQRLNETCLKLTQGQFLDISYENRKDLPLEAYWLMVNGKTAALLEACTALGAMVASSDIEKRYFYQDFGRNLGLAFQAQDDLLGIWGDVNITGKSTASDLITGKKSLPILFGIQQGGSFAQRWMERPVIASEIPEVAAVLEAEGARDYTQQATDRFTQQALTALEAAHPRGEAGIALHELAHLLLRRIR